MAYKHGDAMTDAAGNFAGYFVDPNYKAPTAQGGVTGTWADGKYTPTDFGQSVGLGTATNGVSGSAYGAPPPPPMVGYAPPAPPKPEATSGGGAFGLVGGALKAPAPPLASGGIIGGAITPAPGKNGAPLATAPMSSAFGMVGGAAPSAPSAAPMPTVATGGASMSGPGARLEDGPGPAPSPFAGVQGGAPAPAAPNAIRAALNSMSFGTPAADAVSVPRMRALMAQNGWTSAQVAAELGQPASFVDNMLAKYPASAPAPAGSPFGGVQGSGAPAASAPAGTPAAPTAAPASPPGAIRQALNGLQFGTPEVDGPSTKAMIALMKQNGWSSAAVAAELKVPQSFVDEMISKYGGGAEAPGYVPGTGAVPGIIGGAKSSAAMLADPAAWQVTDSQTVEGRMQNLIKDGNPFIEQARARSNERANASGLLNSSMALTAGEAAAYEAALPVAQADAATFAKAAGYNADQRNQFASKNIDAENQFRINDVNNQQAKDIALLNRESNVIIAKLNNENQVTADKVKADNDKILQTNSRANEVFNTGMSAISAIENNAGMDADTKTRAIANVWLNIRMQLKVMGDVAGIDLVSKLDMRNVEGFDAQGNYTGQFGGAPAPAPAPSGDPTPVVDQP